MFVALMALADLTGLPSLLFTLLLASIAADFRGVALGGLRLENPIYVRG